MHRAQNSGQQIVEVVRDAAGQSPHRLQPLRLAQLVLRRLALGDLFAQRLRRRSQFGQRRLLRRPALRCHAQHQPQCQRHQAGQREGDQSLLPPYRQDGIARLRVGDEQRLMAHPSEAGQPCLAGRVSQPNPVLAFAAARQPQQCLSRAILRRGRLGWRVLCKYLAVLTEQRELAAAPSPQGLPVLLEVARQHRAQDHAVEPPLRVQPRPAHGEGQHAGRTADQRLAEIQTVMARLVTTEVVPLAQVDFRRRPAGADGEQPAVGPHRVKGAQLLDSLLQRQQPRMHPRHVHLQFGPGHALHQPGDAVEHQRIGLHHLQDMFLRHRQNTLQPRIGLGVRAPPILPGKQPGE